MELHRLEVEILRRGDDRRAPLHRTRRHQCFHRLTGDVTIEPFFHQLPHFRLEAPAFGLGALQKGSDSLTLAAWEALSERLNARGEIGFLTVFALTLRLNDLGGDLAPILAE